MKYFEKVTPDNFRETDYLYANADVRIAVSEGLYNCGREHFDKCGVNENRLQYADGFRRSFEPLAKNNPCLCDFSAPESEAIDETARYSLRQFLNCELEPLYPVFGKGFENIYAPVEFANKEKIGITSSFLENAREYHKKSFNVELVKKKIERALGPEHIEYLKNRKPLIFDVGSGSGNTVFACAQLFEGCRVMATDLSPQMLAILDEVRREQYPGLDVEAVAVDALDAQVAPESFDIFIGGSILHHLIDTQVVYDCAYKCLKKGGIAILSEPMLSGHIVYASILETLCYVNTLVNRWKRLHRDIAWVFEYQLKEHKLRRSLYDIVEGAQVGSMDDKFMFVRREIEESAKASGFSKVIIKDLVDAPRYSSLIASVLKVSGCDFEDLPDWAKSIIHKFDETDAIPNHNDIMIEGVIVLQKL